MTNERADNSGCFNRGLFRFTAELTIKRADSSNSNDNSIGGPSFAACLAYKRLGGGAEEEVGAGDAEEDVWCPGGEDGGEGVDVAEGLEDEGDDPIGDG
jgi:hypothetical protein